MHGQGDPTEVVLRAAPGAARPKITSYFVPFRQALAVELTS